MRALKEKRPSRTWLTAFAVALGATTAGAIALVSANSGSDEVPDGPPEAEDWTPADPAPEVMRLEPVDPSDVPADGLVIGRLRLLPPGSVPGDAYAFQLHPNEQMHTWDPAVSEIDVEPGDFAVPETADWSVDRHGGMVTTGENPRLVQEAITIFHDESEHPWELTIGPLLEGAVLDQVMNERTEANFTYTHSGVTATVIDGSPSGQTDRVWHIKLVVGDQWLALIAPVVPFDVLAAFIDEVIEANS